MKLHTIHHVAIICSDYQKTKHFYTTILGLEAVSENYRAQRKSFKLDLALPSGVLLEIFSFPEAPRRPSYPEACGLRHLAFGVSDLNAAMSHLEEHGVKVEPVRIDEHTGKRFTFFPDPDGLPLELYEDVDSEI
ncbi:VOC family protein [Desulfosediminicola ganghwensis]|uniref:SMU1112c/YaeR family gloxylase I-like metalloprotein n=1 Tax=Desulfosediminicola ganghwensis TaxID=2569540 RepID=UPI0010AC7850|nr:VOC family protein [Desulfosediminicola ganghwensis]